MQSELSMQNYEPEGIRMTKKNGVPSEKRCKEGLQHILTIPGSGHTVKNSKEAGITALAWKRV